MRFEAPPITPSLRPLRNHNVVDEDAVTLRLRPLRWRDRVLPDVVRWAGASATVAAVAGVCVFFASPSQAARIEAYSGGAEVSTAPMTVVDPVLDQARFVTAPETNDTQGSFEGEEEEDVIIILDEEEDEDEVVIFDNALDAPSAAAMAMLHIERSEHALAVTYALEAAEAQPRNAAHQTLLGQAYRLSGDRRAARAAFRRARRLRR